jgi:Zn-dependent protease
MRTYVIGPVLGLRTTLEPLFWPSYMALALLAALLAHGLVHLTFWPALLAGLLSALLFLVCEWLHQFGHALMARSVGHPMLGIRFFNLFSGSQYPADEPPLPPATHVRRALGGFWVNLLIGLLLLPVASRLWPQGREILPPAISVVGWLAGFGLVTNVLVLGLGALVPLNLPGGGPTDGATLLKFWLASRAARARAAVKP